MKLRSIALSVVLATSSLLAASPPPTLQDDAYHFPQFQDGQHDGFYAEWWYFNLIDTVQDLHFVVAYSIFSPASAAGRAAVTALAYTADDTVTLTGSFPTAAFSASTATPDVSVARVNTVQVVGSDNYQVAGSLEADHSISWFLEYAPRTAPWQGSAGDQVGKLPWERMSWLNYLPDAEVQGWVMIDGRTYLVSGAAGYHDHNWGEWIPSEVVWNWAQYAEPGFSLGLGDFRSYPTGVLGIEVDGQRTEFKKDEYFLLHTKWADDQTTGLPVPTESWLLAANAETTVLVHMEVDRTQALLPPPELPFVILQPVIYEQTANFTGSLWVRDEAGAWTLSRSFAGPGFKEFTGRASAK